MSRTSTVLTAATPGASSRRFGAAPRLPRSRARLLLARLRLAAVAVAVVAATRPLDLVEDDAEHADMRDVESGLGPLRGDAVGLVQSGDEDDAIGLGGEHGGVGDGEQRWGVDDH